MTVNKDQNFRQNSLRRIFLKRAAASAAGLGIAGVTETMAIAAKMKIPPIPENVMTADAALERLMKGNYRYVAGLSTPLNFAADRAALVTGQNPYATILSCSDSRVSPEFCFDEQRGDLFVARVAGNYLTTDFVATLEYAAVVLHTPLIMVLVIKAVERSVRRLARLIIMSSFRGIYNPLQARSRRRSGLRRTCRATGSITWSK